MMPGTDNKDSFNLGRFVEAQEPVYEQVCRELREGSKRSHWMWFIFPQMRGLGYSWTAMHYAISSLDEAKAYLSHPILGPRLFECCSLVMRIQGIAIQDIFDYPDYLKFHSSMTLFNEAIAGPENPFRAALEKYYNGHADPLTLERLRTL